jgi:hypothetical protein
MEPMPIYTTHGDWAAMLLNHMLYSPTGDWIGWVDLESKVWSVHGEYVGWLNADRRILRKREGNPIYPRRVPPPAPPRQRFPPNVALPPLMADLKHDTLDVFEDMPERIDPADMNDVPDMD